MPFDPDKYLESKDAEFNPDAYLKKKGDSETVLEVGSEVGGLYTTPDQPTSLGYQRILKAGKIPTNPFEKAALGQPAIDEQKSEVPEALQFPKMTKEEMQSQLPVIDKMISDIDEKASLNIGKDIHVYGFGKEQEDLLLARRMLNKTKRIIESPDKEGLNSVLSGLRRKDLSDFLSLGLTEMKGELKTANINNKNNKGEEITDEENLVLASRYLHDLMDANKGKPSSYNIGNAIAEIAPFIGQLALTKGIGTAAEQGVVTAGKKLLTAETANILKKYGLDDALKTFAGAAAQAPLTPMMWTRYGKERIGQLEEGEDGKLKQVEGTGSTRGSALLESYGTAVSSIFSEKVGDIMAKRFSSSGVGIGQNLSKTKSLESINNFKKNAYWSGLGWEYFEEQVDGVGQAIASDDAKLSDILDSKQQLETLATLAIIGGGFKAVEIPGYLKEKKFKKDFENSQQLFNEQIDEGTRRIIDSAIDTDNVNDMWNSLKNEDVSHLSPQQQKITYDYIKNKIRYNSLYTASQTKPEEETVIDNKNKEQEAVKTKSDTKVQPVEKTPQNEDKTVKITLTEKSPISEDDKAILQLEGGGLFTRQINKDGERLGQITVEETNNTWNVKDVVVDEENKGYGKDVYRQMNDMAQEEGKVIASGIPTKDTSKKATYMWDSLVKSGEAIKNEDGTYQMLPKKEVIEFANRIKSGEKMESPEDLQFYENNKKAIESQLKITEEPTDAEGIRENARPIQEGGNVGQEGQGESGQNLQQPEEAGPIASNEEEVISTTPIKDEYRSRIDNLDDTNQIYDKEQLAVGDYIGVKNSPKGGGVMGFVKKIGPKNVTVETFFQKGSTNDEGELIELKVAKEDIDSFYKPKVPQEVKQEGLAYNAKEINIIGSEIALDKPDRKDYEEGSVGDKKYTEDNIKHNDKVNATIMNIKEDGTLTDMQGNEYSVTVGPKGVVVLDSSGKGIYRNGKVGAEAPFTKGFKFKPENTSGKKTKQDTQEKKVEIEPEMARKLRVIADKIRAGKISKIPGVKATTPFQLVWDGGLEVLADKLETLADLTAAINEALTYIKNTDWYKNLGKEKQTEFDTKFTDHIENELGKEYRDATKYQFVNKEVGERIQAATISPKTFSEKAKEVFTDLKNKITRTYRDLPKNKRFAEAYNAISQFQKALDISSSKAGVNIRDILGKMQKADYDLFTYKIIFDDLAETIKLNPDYILPYALTPEALTQEIANINKYIGFNTKVQDAIARRKEAYKEIQGNYTEYAKKVGINTEGYFERNDYFRHQVLLYSELSKSTVERKGGPLQRPKNLSLFKQRKQGKGYDINRNYIEAEFEVFNKLLYAIEKMKMIDNVYRNYDITKDLKAEAKKELGEDATRQQVDQWVSDNIPEGYVIDSPENMNIFMAQSIPESLVQDLMLGNVEEMGIKRDDLRKIFALGASKKIVIPVELYKTMDNISQIKTNSSYSKAAKKSLTGWKIWSLIGPKRFIKYNLRNISGDAEAVFLGNIRVFRKVIPSFKELWSSFVKHEPPTLNMNKYIERGGTQLVITTQEIGDIKKIKQFENMYDTKRNMFVKAFDAYWRTVKSISDFREQLLRYAAFLESVEEQETKGKVINYGASNPEFIDGLSDKYDKAFRISNELLGAYDEIGEAGQNIRQYWIPFWSFQEVNFRRTNQIFMNALSDKSFEGKALKGLELLAKKTPFMALKATKLAIKLSAFWGMTAVWNALLFGDEEDDLPEYITSRPHVIFGRNPDGTVRYLSRLGVMGDYLEWFGFDSMPMYISEYLSGRMTPREISKELMTSGANKLIGGVNPYFKTPIELFILKKSLFPDFTNPKVIRNNGEYVAIALGLKDEYRAITKLPDKDYYKSLRKLFWDEIEPMEASYWSIIAYKYKFKAKQKGGSAGKNSFAITDKSAALYYYKQSLLYGDTKSAEYYLDKYILLGGTKKGYGRSMSYLNPMRGISDKEKDEFIKFLGPKNKRELDRAMEYYEKVVNSKLEWPNDKMDKETDGEEIPQ